MRMGYFLHVHTICLLASSLGSVMAMPSNRHRLSSVCGNQSACLPTCCRQADLQARSVGVYPPSCASRSVVSSCAKNVLTAGSLSHAVVNVAGNNINLNAPFLQSGAQAVRIIDPTNKTSTLIGTLDRTRLGVTLTTMGDGNILIMGGNQQVCLHLGQALCFSISNVTNQQINILKK